jgi:hypothetical protein
MLSFSMAGCGSLNTQTLGELNSGYTYIPIDPMSVTILKAKCVNPTDDLLNTLPDNTVRLSMELTDLSGKVTYGTSKVGATGSAYKLTADYVNSDTVNETVWIKKTVLVRTRVIKTESGQSSVDYKTERKAMADAEAATKAFSSGTLGVAGEDGEIMPGTEVYYVKAFRKNAQPTQAERKGLQDDKYEEHSVPIYVGIGLRVVAEGTSNTEDANISGIGVVGAEAEASRLTGTLTVQTLGVNSQGVASVLPVTSQLSRISAENAFVAIGTIKAMLHQPETMVFPRVVGFYMPFPGGKPLVNALISEFSKTPVEWCPSPGYHSKSNNAAPVKPAKETLKK